MAAQRSVGFVGLDHFFCSGGALLRSTHLSLPTRSSGYYIYALVYNIPSVVTFGTLENCHPVWYTRGGEVYNVPRVIHFVVVLDFIKNMSPGWSGVCCKGCDSSGFRGVLLPHSRQVAKGVTLRGVIVGAGVFAGTPGRRQGA